jgi:biotin transporter BioY
MNDNNTISLIDVSNTKALLKDAFLIIGFSFLTGISANLKIETGTVPITMQTFVVLLSGALLGSKRGALSQLTYLFMGLSGVFWFARGGGFSYVFSPTFGYIIGFVFSAYAVGLLFEKRFNAVFSLFIGNFVLYLPGLFWLSFFVGIERVLSIGFYPFILGDLIKIGLAELILFGIIKQRS